MGVPALAPFPLGSVTKSAAPADQLLSAPGCFFPSPSGKQIYKFAAPSHPHPPELRAILLHFVKWAGSPGGPLLSFCILESPEVRWREEASGPRQAVAAEESGQLCYCELPS